MADKNKSGRWLLHALLFAGLFAALFVHTSYTMRRNVGSSAQNLQGFTRETAPVDVLFIGGSSTYVYWIPMQAYDDSGITSYDYAGDSLPPSVIKNLIIESRKHQTAKLYVIDLRAVEVMQHDPGFYTEEYLRLYTDVLPYSANRNDMIQTAFAASEAEVKNKASLYLDLLYYHGNWRDLTQNNFRYWDLPELDGQKGFYFLNLEPNPVTLTDYSAVTRREPLAPKVEGVLRDLLEYCKGEGLDVLFIVNPFSQQGENVKQVFNSVEDMVGEYGYPFLDANEHYDELALDPNTEFPNVNHVNIFGAQKLTAWLNRYLLEHYQLADHRGEAAYASWDAALPHFRASVEGFIDSYCAEYGVERKP